MALVHLRRRRGRRWRRDRGDAQAGPLRARRRRGRARRRLAGIARASGIGQLRRLALVPPVARQLIDPRPALLLCCPCCADALRQDGGSGATVTGDAGTAGSGVVTGATGAGTLASTGRAGTTATVGSRTISSARSMMTTPSSTVAAAPPAQANCRPHDAEFRNQLRLTTRRGASRATSAAAAATRSAGALSVRAAISSRNDCAASKLVHFIRRIGERCGETLRILIIERAVEIGREPFGRVAVRRARLLRARDRRMKRCALGRRSVVAVRLGEDAFEQIVEFGGHGVSPSRH